MTPARTVVPRTDQDLLYSEVEQDLRSSVHDLLADRCPPAAVLTRCEDRTPHDLALWRALSRDLGVAGLLVPPAHGGHGATAREAAVVLEELGASVAPVPFLTSAVVATTALLGCSGAADEIARLASGAATAVLTVPLSTAPGSAFPQGVRADAAGVLTGRVTSVGDAGCADLLVVPATGPRGPGLYAVHAGARGLGADLPVSLDLTRPLVDIHFDRVAARPLAGPGAAEPALATALLTGAGLLASEQLGIAQWCLDTTVRHLGERSQFGRPVGSFQALKHRLADRWLEVVSARAAARSAADALASGSTDAPVAVAVAQAYCAPVAVRAAEECLQLHGGIGMTWEHPLHLFLKRAKADEVAFGTPGRHRAALAGLVGLPA